MKVAVYLAAVPAKTKNQAKRDLLTKFAGGVQAAGDQVTLIDRLDQIVNADVAVLQGWIGMKSGPHLELRSRVIQHQKRINAHTLVIDSNLFGFLAPDDRDRYLRYSLDGIFPTTGYYFDSKIDFARWPGIAGDYRFSMKSWTNGGKNVLICLQRDGGWSMDGLSIVQWLDQVIPQIRKHSQRPIVIRPHPGSLQVLPEVRKRWPDILISEKSDIRQDLDDAWCTVIYNSSPGVASLLWGVPVFVTDPTPQRSQAWPMVCTDLAKIDSPDRPDRVEWLHRLSQCHFRTDTLPTGDAWRFMRDRLPSV